MEIYKQWWGDDHWSRLNKNRTKIVRYHHHHHVVPFARISVTLSLLCFDLLTRPKMPFKVMHRKGVTHSNGSYERKSRDRKYADEMGRGIKKIPLYSHRLMHRKRVTSELHDSYFRSMTITQAIPKVAEVTHPGL